MNTLINYYVCRDCLHEWDTTWNCACNDKCPECNSETEPFETEELDGSEVLLMRESLRCTLMDVDGFKRLSPGEAGEILDQTIHWLEIFSKSVEELSFLDEEDGLRVVPLGWTKLSLKK